MDLSRLSTLPVRLLSLNLTPVNSTVANATGIGGWDDALGKAKAFVSQLTLEEKSKN